MTQKGFLKFVAYLQIIGIILVVLGHSGYMYPDGHHGNDTLLYRTMHSFRMPLFIFTSGFLLELTTSRKNRSWLSLTKSKIQRLLIPFLTLTLIIFVPRALLSGMAEHNVQLSWSALGNALLHSNSLVVPYFWFLQASFTLLVFTYAFIDLGRKHNIPPIFYYSALAAFFIFLYLSPYEPTDFFAFQSTIWLAPFFVLGCAYGAYFPKIDAFIPWQKPLMFLVFAAIWALLFFFGSFLQLAKEWLVGVFGIAMMISLAKYIEAKNYTFLDHLTGANYIIFLLSWFLNVAAQQMLAHFVNLPWYVHSFLSLSLGIYVPWLFYKYMCRNKHKKLVKTCAYLLGQSLR